jgi:8-oxo-dGTP pyrophosphatase MutT (NUDIX family)
MTPNKSIVFNKSNDHKTACVMVLLAPVKNTWKICLIQRQINPLDVHSGQISLPGGKLELSDQSHLDCAMRETFEEIGIPSEQINPIGGLTSIYTSASNFNIHPFVGYMDRDPIFILQASEVQRVITYPLESLLDPLSKSRTSIKLSNGLHIDNVPFYKSEYGLIWGATAMILSELEHILQTH